MSGLVYIASPLKPVLPEGIEPTPARLGAIYQRNIAYAKLATLDSLVRGESPLTVHVLYTAVLDDKIPAHRRLGMTAGVNALEFCQGFAAYIDLGWSDGMKAERTNWLRNREELRLQDERWLFPASFIDLSVGNQTAMILDAFEALQAKVQ